MPFIVQFPHPGSEHTPRPPRPGTVMPYNRGPHKRKFVTSTGEYVVGGEVRHGDVAFWTEWEAPSGVLDTWPKEGRKPRFLQQPYIESVPDGVKHQNIDPLVFGPHFLYTNCKQNTIKRLQRLPPGSMILFGSGQGHGFVLDTVFVVASEGQPFEIGERDVVPDHPGADALVFRPLGTSRKHHGKTCRAYRSTTFTEGRDRLFSYVPCRPITDDVRFERPLLEPSGALEGIITPKLKMGVRINDVDDAAVASAWQHVRGVVESQDLALGVHFPLPGTLPGATSSGSTSREGESPARASTTPPTDLL